MATFAHFSSKAITFTIDSGVQSARLALDAWNCHYVHSTAVSHSGGSSSQCETWVTRVISELFQDSRAPFKKLNGKMNDPLSASEHLCVCAREPKVDTGCPSISLFLIFRDLASLNLGLCHSARTLGQRARGILLSLLSQEWDCSCAALKQRNMGAGDSNSSHHLPVEPSLQSPALAFPQFAQPAFARYFILLFKLDTS